MVFGGGLTGGLGTGIVFNLHDQFSNTADRISAKFDKLNGLSDVAVQRFNAAQSGIRKGLAMVLVAAVALAPILMATKASADFHFQLAAVGAKARATGDDLKHLRANAIELGEATRFSALQVAEGQEFLAMAGFNVSQIIQAMPGMLDLAAAGQLGLAEASDIASNVLQQFGMKASQVGRVADVMAVAANSSNTSVTEYAEAMKYLGITSSAMKIPLEEASATIMALANTGMKAGFATRQFSNILMSLGSPSKQASQSLKELGIDVFDSTGTFIGIIDMVDKLNVKMAGMTDQTKLGHFKNIFTAGGAQEIIALMNATTDVMKDGRIETLKGADALRQFQTMAQNSEGAAKRMADAMLDNLKGDMIILGSVYDTMMIKIGTTAEKMMRKPTQVLTSFLSVIGMIAESPLGGFLISAITLIASATAVFGLFIVAVHLARFAAAKAGMAFLALGKNQLAATFLNKGLIGGMRSLIVTTYASARANLAASFSISSMNTRMRALQINAVRSRIAMASSMAVVKGGIVGMFTYAKSLLGAAMGSGALTWSTTALKVSFMSLNAALGPIGWTLIAIAAAAMVVYKSIGMFKKVMDGSSQPATGFKGVMQRLGGVMMGISAVFGSATKDGFEMSKSLHDSLEKIGVLEMVENIGTWAVRLTAFWGGVKQGVSEVFEPIRRAFNAISIILNDLGISFWKNTSDVQKWVKWGKVFGVILGGLLLTAVISMTAALWSMAVAVVAATWPVLAVIAVIAALIYAFQNWGEITEWVKEKWSQFAAWYVGIWGRILDSIKGVSRIVHNAGRSFIEWLKEGMYSAFLGLWNWVKGAFSSVGEWFVGIPETLFNIGASLITSLWEGIKSKIAGMFEWLTGIGATIAGAFGSLFGIDTDMNMNVNHAMAGGGMGGVAPVAPIIPLKPNDNNGNIEMPTNRKNMGVSETGKYIAQEKSVTNNNNSRENTIEKYYHTKEVETIQVVMPDGRVLAQTVNGENAKNKFRKDGRD